MQDNQYTANWMYKKIAERNKRQMEKNKDPFGYEQLNRYGSYKWMKYVMKVHHIHVDGFDKIKWFYVVATSVNHAIDVFKDQYAKNVDWINGEYMIIMGVYDKQDTAYIGDYKGNKLPPLK